jgi:hypothetical protein
MIALTCDRSRPRHYSDGERQYFSVSQVISVLLGRDGLDHETPAMVRGTDLHTIFALESGAYAGLCARPNVPEEYAHHYRAFRDWLTRTMPSILAIEQPSRHARLPYAGTPDLILKIGGVVYVLDLKTGQEQPWHRIQVMAYSRLMGYRGIRPALLYVHEGGAKMVQPKPTRADWAAFVSALNILVWRESL